MPAFFKFPTARKSKEKSLPAQKKEKGRAADASPTSQYLETSRVVEAGLFFLFAALVVIICFLGQRPKGLQIIPGLPAPSRIVAEFPFEYNSKVLVDERARAVRAQVPPIFQRTFEPFELFRQTVSKLNSQIAETQINFEAEGEEKVQAELVRTTSDLIEAEGLDFEASAISLLTTLVTPMQRSELFNKALDILRTLYEDGIYPSHTTESGLSQVTVVRLMDEEGRVNLPNSRSLEDARIALRVRINALSGNMEIARSLFEIFNAGLSPNLLYNPTSTARAIERAVSEITPPLIQIKEGATLVEPGAIVSELEIERVKAYRDAELARGGDSLVFNKLFIERLTLTLILLVAVLIYLNQGLRELHKRNRAIAVTAVAILLNLLIIRLITEVGEIALLNSRPSLRMLPFIAPYALAPILIASLVGAAPAVLSALIVATLFGIMQGNSIEFMLISFLSGVVGSYVSLNIRNRSRLVRSGLMAGGTAALTGAIIGLIAGLTLGLVGQQILIALIIGIFTGILAIGLLPVFENLFKITTEITLLELTDFNHPLLRRMQIEAPGTYHHSLMVANLSENAAAAIGASPLLCRVCCLFHDIGKLVKPEYFVENQKGGINPHDEKNPSMSALVIKAHVKEGVDMARKFKLPRVIIDVIRQHHGTGLIQFFYYQAQQQLNKESHTPIPTKGKRPAEAKKVDESTYRYDGPRPRFKESAIIFFADGVEAASRSLRKVTQPAVEELIDTIIKDRIEDGQLDECPLTFKELDQIRSSFTYTVLNMLHSRIEYPGKDKKTDQKQQTEDPTKEPHANPATPGDKQPV